MIIKRDDIKRMSAIEPTASDLLYYEDLSVGQRWVSPGRQITEDDVETFSDLTGDFDPLHKGNDDSPFGRPIAHGLLGLSVLAGLSTEFPRAATLALVGLTDWQFEKPIYFGDTVHVVTEVAEIQPHGRRAGRITWLRKLICDDGRVLQQGNFVTLVASQSRAPGGGTARVTENTSAVPRQPR